MPIAAFVFRNRPEDVGQRRDGILEGLGDFGETPQIPEQEIELTVKATLKSRAFWIVTAVTAWFGLVQTAIFFSLVPLFLDRSMTDGDATSMMAVFAGSLAFSHFVSGYLADHWKATTLLAAGMASFGASLWCLYFMQKPAMGCGIVMGISQGIYFGASYPLWARYFGRRNLGKVRGILMTINVAASSAGPLIAGLIRDATGTFDGAILLFSVVPIPLAIVCLLATPPREEIAAIS